MAKILQIDGSTSMAKFSTPLFPASILLNSTPSTSPFPKYFSLQMQWNGCRQMANSIMCQVFQKVTIPHPHQPPMPSSNSQIMQTFPLLFLHFGAHLGTKTQQCQKGKKKLSVMRWLTKKPCASAACRLYGLD
jgi:hypothetical protein